MDLPLSSYKYFEDDKKSWDYALEVLIVVTDGHLLDQNGNRYYLQQYNDDGYPTFSDEEAVKVEKRLKLSEAQEDWREITRELIADAKDPNQALVTEKVFRKESKTPLVYNEMKFASQSEIRIAQELEKRGVLFLPLPLAVRHETGNFYKDHREVDFLICEDGVWGVLEVAYHPNRYEQDKEKDAWFKKSGILCTEHYTAERCFNHPSEVVEEFLGVLQQHKR